MQQEAEAVSATPVGDSVEAQKLRMLENRLEKAIVKCNESTHISKTYEYIVQKLQEVGLCTYIHISVTQHNQLIVHNI